MKRSAPLVLLLVLAVLLTGCGGTTPPPAAPSPSPSQSPSQSPSSAAASPARPLRVTARTLGWRLPVASGRQAVIPVGAGRVVLAGGLLAGDSSAGSAYRIDLRAGHVVPLPALAVPVHDSAGGLLGTAPTVFGGGNATEQAVVQSLRGGRWRVVGNLPTTRSDLSVATEGARSLVIGGYDGVSVPRPLLSVGPAGHAHRVGRLVRGVRYAATAQLGHTVYVFGGEANHQELDAVQAVDVSSGRTRVVGHLPVPLGHAMAATVGDRILLVGGRVSPNAQTAGMWLYDPGRGTFRKVGRLPRPLSDAGIASDGGTIWLLGGEQPLVTDQVVRIRVH